MKILTGTISHETSTFTPVPTTMRSFSERFGELQPDQIIPAFRGANVPTGGFIEAAEAHGFELVPTIFAEAHPSGPVPRRDLDRLLDRMLGLMKAASPADGVLLELHGSMAAEGIDDGEAFILAAVRDLVGPEVPIVAQLDIHSNVSQRMVELADVLIGRETYPEVDMAARGRECADVMVRIVREGLRPTMALSQIPMFWGLNQVTGPPAHERSHRTPAPVGGRTGRRGRIHRHLFSLGRRAARGSFGPRGHGQRPGVGPTPRRRAGGVGSTGAGPIGTTTFPPPGKRWTRRRCWAGYPAVFADRNDNTGGGSPGDSTGLLRTFLDRGLKDACVLYIVDHESALACHRAGPGAAVSLQVGGKSTPSQGPPVPVEAVVEAVSDGDFAYNGPMYAGLRGNMGVSARIRVDGVHVLLVSVREQPFDTAFSLTLGLDPKKMRYIGLKSAAHFRAGFEEWAGQIQVVSEPGVHSPDAITYERLGRRVYPLGGERRES